VPWWNKFKATSLKKTVVPKLCLLRESLAKARWKRKDETFLKRCIAKAHSDRVHCIQFAGSLVFSGGADHRVRVWDLTTGAQLQIHAFNATVWAMIVKGDVLVTGCGGN
jgi:WD40 repeat protein